MHVFPHTSGVVGDVLSQGLTIDEETCGFEPFGRVAIDSLYLYSKNTHKHNQWRYHTFLSVIIYNTTATQF